MKKTQEEELQRKLLAGQLCDMERHIREVEHLYYDLRSLRHDIGSHVLTLESLYRRGAYPEAGDYLEKLKSRLKEAAPAFKSGSPVTDVILAEKQAEAGKRGVAFSCSFRFPEHTGMDVFDLSVVLNNALSNALEAAAGCPGAFVSVASARRKNTFLLEIRNSLLKKCPLDPETGLPMPDETRGGDHGFGLSNIRRTAKKYHGDIAIEQAEGQFLLSVLFLLPQETVCNEKKPVHNISLSPSKNRSKFNPEP